MDIEGADVTCMLRQTVPNTDSSNREGPIVMTMMMMMMTEASKPRGNDAFCVIGNVGGKLKVSAMSCVLRYRRCIKLSK